MFEMLIPRSVSAAILQWLMEYPPWDLQELCARYRFRENRQLYALQVSLPFSINQGNTFFVLAKMVTIDPNQSCSIL